MIAAVQEKRSDGAAQPWLYFALVQILSIPFYWGELTPLQEFPFYGWPAAVAVILVPATVATVLTGREQGAAAALRLWGRIGDVRRIRGARWALFALLMSPAVALVAYGIVRYFDLPLPSVIRFTAAVRRRGTSPPSSSARSLRRSARPDMLASPCRNGMVLFAPG
jgi:hypothetical protein